MLLWAGPGILLLIGIGTLATVLARRRKGGGVQRALSEEDRRRAEALLATATDGKGKTTV